MPRSGLILKRAIHVARAAAGIRSDVALADAAGMRYQTLMDWYADRSRPTPGPLSKIAEVLDMPVADLWAAWEGRPTRPDDIAELVAALDRHTEAVTALVEELRAALTGVEQGLRVAAMLREGEGSGLPNGQPSRVGAAP